jgi:GTP-binding protein LepA
MKHSSKNIRNFCIIAHIDHGKSTLADRFLEVTKTISEREMKHGQMLDTMELEQERGITIKLQPVRMYWDKGDTNFQLNLIDTPGHVDFSYEVSRSLAACEGAILVVDASQGIQAQTLANSYMAIEHDLEIIPVLNKIDLPAADVEKRSQELCNVFGFKPEEILQISAKEGTNVEELLNHVIDKVPPPEPSEESEGTKALIFDSMYDSYRGVVAYVRVMDGELKRGNKIRFLNTKAEAEVLEVGYLQLKMEKSDVLSQGEVGYVITGVKDVKDARVGDTIWQADDSGKEAKDITPLPGYKKVTPFVFASVYCTDGADYPMLRDALDKLSLNDSALSFEPEQSTALGHGFRCGFLGLLHLDIVQERLEREYNLDLIITAPGVSYIIQRTDGEEEVISNPAFLPESNHYVEIREPWVMVEVLVPKDYVGGVMKLLDEARGKSKSMKYLDETRVQLTYEVPLAEIVMDFYDQLKSATAGYASMSYEFLDYRAGNLVKLDMLVAGDKLEALSTIVHRDAAYNRGILICKKLKELLPKMQFEIAIQAAIGGKILARETLAAMRKDVTAGLYGGDVSRKKKVLAKQKKGKKRMKMMGKVSVPQEAFMAVLKRD